MIDFRQHDQHEHGLTPKSSADIALEYSADLRLAQRIRDGLDAKREAEAFDAAEKRMRAGA